MMQLSTFLESLGFKPTGKREEYVSDCWLCQGQRKLYYNIVKNVGFCQKCSTRVSLFDIARDLAHVSPTSIKGLLEEARLSAAHTQNFRETVMGRFYKEPFSEILPVMPRPSEFVPLSELHNSMIAQKTVLAYLRSRNLPIHRMTQMGFGACFRGFYANRLIIPFYENDQLVYWQARDFTGLCGQADKILNPPSAITETGKSQVLFNYDVARGCESLFITESWGSALATGICAVGINGKSMSPRQFQKLIATKAQRFVVLLDHGAEDKALQIAEQLSKHRTTLVASLPHGDPNEVPRSVLLQAVRDAEPYSATYSLRLKTEVLRRTSHA